MISFTRPAVLLLLVLPAILLAWVWRRGGQRLMLPFDHGLRHDGYGRRRLVSWKRALASVITLAESLPAMILAVIVVLLAGPQQLSTPATKRKMSNIEFAVDISGSMTGSFGSGTRYDKSMEAINEFLDFRQGDAYGLTFFGNSVMHWVPLTTDASAFRCAPPFMDPKRTYIPGFGGTAIGKALRACRDVLVQRDEGDRMIILVSDGFSSDLSGGNDQQIAKLMRKDNIVVYGIHIAESEVPEAIINITALTGGEVFNPGDAEGLQSVFRRIDQMQQTEMEKTAAEVMDNFAPFCIAALSMLGLCTSSLFGLRYTPW